MDKQQFWTAFFAAQSNFTSPKKSGINGFANGHKYHKLEDLLPAVHSVLSEQDIFFHFEDINSDETAGTRIWMHHMPSGQQFTQDCVVDKKARDAQSCGGCYTYAKRYLLASLFLISDPKLDDDADRATHGDRKQKPKIASDSRIAKIKKDLAEIKITEERALKLVGAETWILSLDQADQLEMAIINKKAQ